MKSVEALPELARLIHIWAERGFRRVHSVALMRWADETAARSVRHPAPELGAELMTQLRLWHRQSDGRLRPDEELLRVYEAETSASSNLDRIPRPVATLILERLLTFGPFSTVLEECLELASYSDAGLLVPWVNLSSDQKTQPGWMALQRLGLAQHRADGVLVLDPMLSAHAAEVPPKRRPVPQAELENRLELQSARAALAEEYIVEMERARLMKAGRDDLAAGVERISVHDSGAGFDVRSFDLNDSERYVEVKSSAGPRERFYCSDNEVLCAERLRSSYWLAWVGWASRLPNGLPEVQWVQDPYRVFKSASRSWEVRPSSFLVEARKVQE